MTHTYHITGMTCKSCVGKVLNELLKLGDITNASVQLESPQATISMHNHIPLKSLQQAISKAGNYLITHADREAGEVGDDAERKNWWQAYKPIFLIFFYVIALSLIAGNSKNGFDGWTAMRIFMSGFFLCFSFFKFLDLRGFADSYATYDVVAKRFHSWGYIYAFIELA
ncbi:MAG: heavy-metal-associated domain-containing protein, partial [Pedobacter sp.]